MTMIQAAALAVLGMFYISYFTKMVLQRRRGIQTDQISKGGKPKQVLRVERRMKIATFSIVPVEVISILLNYRVWGQNALNWAGIGMGLLGVLVFIAAMATMRDNWRAGIPAKDKTELVTTGIYRFSRNPAFLGFDLVYLGLLLAFFNPVHLIFALFAVGMLHLQILQEEAFLAKSFGKEYLEYKEKTGRYFRI